MCPVPIIKGLFKIQKKIIIIGRLNVNISNNFSKFVSTSLIDKKYNNSKGPAFKNLFNRFNLAISFFPYLNELDLQ